MKTLVDGKLVSETHVFNAKYNLMSEAEAEQTVNLKFPEDTLSGRDRVKAGLVYPGI